MTCATNHQSFCLLSLHLFIFPDERQWAVQQIMRDQGGDVLSQLDYYYGLAKRQLLSYQSATSHLYPDTSSNRSEAHLRDSIYCSVAVWSLYQAYRFSIVTNFNHLELNCDITGGWMITEGKPTSSASPRCPA